MTIEVEAILFIIIKKINSSKLKFSKIDYYLFYKCYESQLIIKIRGIQEDD